MQPDNPQAETFHHNRSIAGLFTAALVAITAGGCGDDAGAQEESDTGVADSTGTDPDTSSGALDTGDSSDGGESTGSSGESTGGEAATPIVLVHGAWVGAWCWDDVAPLLEAAGHPTFVVELPAHGEDDTPVADATLAAYRDDVLTVLDGIDGRAAVVGHSLGGMVISEVAEARPESIATLVYVAAFLPQSGQSLLDIGSTDPDSILTMHLVDHGDGTASIDPEFIGEVFCGDCSEEDVAMILELTRPEPLGPTVTPASLTEAAFGSVHKSYVYTELDATVSLAAQQAMVEATPVDDTRSLATAHSPFLSQPEMLADAIVELVEAQ